MKRCGVFGRVDHLGYREKHEARLLAEVLPFQLPNPVPKYIGRTHGLTKNTKCCLAQDLERFSGVAYQDLVKLEILES